VSRPKCHKCDVNVLGSANIKLELLTSCFRDGLTADQFLGMKTDIDVLGRGVQGGPFSPHTISPFTAPVDRERAAPPPPHAVFET
jgi:hypothetical protein